MPAAVMTARTAPPAMTPVPSEAGLSSTAPAPNRPVTVWGMLPLVGDGHADDVLLRRLDALLDGGGDLAGLAHAVAHVPVRRHPPRRGR